MSVAERVEELQAQMLLARLEAIGARLELRERDRLVLCAGPERAVPSRLFQEAIWLKPTLMRLLRGGMQEGL